MNEGEEMDTRRSKQMLAVTKSNDLPLSVEGRGNGIDESSVSSRPHKPKLWSCFPTKGPYKGPSSLNLSQPYLPLERQLSLR